MPADVDIFAVRVIRWIRRFGTALTVKTNTQHIQRKRLCGKRMVVTPLSNLHIYTQRNTRMRKAEFVEDRKQFENKYLRNEGYAVEVPELYAAIDESAVTIGKVSEPAEG